MGNLFSNPEQEHERREHERREHENKLRLQQQLKQLKLQAVVAAEKFRQQCEREAELQLQRQHEEQDRVLQQAQEQATLRLSNARRSIYDYDPHNQYSAFFNNNNNNDNNGASQDYPGYTASDRYYYHNNSQPYTWRESRKANKAYTVSTSGNAGRRKRSRKGKGDLLESDYHAGLSKPEIVAMSSERKAEFECQKLRRQRRESSLPM
ncbi:hypothetical protein BGZ96_008929 [Linnemannia gamsii]|uniref:Uncharacterized protein n=1 Tax=Linnemannia gamsii TaxID=64522 RepID=A0ABQ7JY59_9FUNG|nr:hypothetical protein BGZ96_008929 [Linnemannia gamsii]